MEEKIYQIIKLQNDGISYKNLTKKLDIDTFELKKILLKLKLDGKILQLGNKYTIFPSNVLLGTIIVSQMDKKYIIYDNKNIMISSNFLNEVILNDLVAFKINNQGEADIISIIDRPLSKMTCRINIINGKKRIIPYNQNLNLVLPQEVIDTLYDGDIILVDTTNNELGEVINATFIKKIGRCDDPSIYDTEIALNYGFDNDYSREYLEEITKYPTKVSEEEIIGRHDYRKQKSVTIDGIYTKDMDDGAYAQRLTDNIIRVYIHIADVSHYIKPNSLVFKRACEMTTSVYINNSVFPMLHPTLANGICSLNEGEDRLTKTIIMDIDEDGNIINFDIVKSVINSKKKMDYDSVDKIFLNNYIPNGYEPYVDILKLLYIASLRLQKRYLKNGKLEFANLETKKTYNQDGSIKEIIEGSYSPSAKIIEYLMLATGQTVGSFAESLGIPFNYRILEEPDSKKLNIIIDKINDLGFNIRHVGDVGNSHVISKIIDKVKNTELFPLISSYLIIGMQRAEYNTNNIGHYALGMDNYSQFTSPIRRLTDLENHIIIDMVLDDYKIYDCDLNKIETKMQALAKKASLMERQADKAEADGERRLIILKLAKLKDEELEATVCEIDNKIRIKLYGIDTYLDNSDLIDNFMFDHKKKLFYEKNTKEYLRPGTAIIVKIKDTNPANRTFKVNVLGIIKKDIKKKSLVK